MERFITGLKNKSHPIREKLELSVNLVPQSLSCKSHKEESVLFTAVVCTLCAALYFKSAAIWDYNTAQ